MTPLITADDVATWLGVGRLRVYELARAGLLPCVRIGRSVRFDRVAVEQWIRAGGTPTAEIAE